MVEARDAGAAGGRGQTPTGARHRLPLPCAPMRPQWLRHPTETDADWAAYLDYCQRRLHVTDDADAVLAPVGADADRRCVWDARAAAFDAELIRRRALNAAEAASLAANRIISLAAAGVHIASDDALAGLAADDTGEGLPELSAALQIGCRIMTSSLEIARAATRPDDTAEGDAATRPDDTAEGENDASGERGPLHAVRSGPQPPRPQIGTPRLAGTPQQDLPEAATGQAEAPEPEPALSAVGPTPTPEPDLEPGLAAHAPAHEPGPAASPEPEHDPAHDPAPVADPAPDPAPAHDPAPAPAPSPEHDPAPVADPAPDPAHEPAHEPSPEPEHDPAHDPAPVADPAPDPAPAHDPAHEPAPAPSPEPEHDPAHEPAPVADPAHEPLPDPAAAHEPDPDPDRRRGRLSPPTITERCGQRGGQIDHQNRGEHNCELCDAYKNRADDTTAVSHPAVIVPTY